jgi:hypothetical protein
MTTGYDTVIFPSKEYLVSVDNNVIRVYLNDSCHGTNIISTYIQRTDNYKNSPLPPYIEKVELYIGGSKVLSCDNDTIDSELRNFPIYISKLQYHNVELRFTINTSWIKANLENTENKHIIQKKKMIYKYNTSVLPKIDEDTGNIMNINDICIKKEVECDIPQFSVALPKIVFVVDRNFKRDRTILTPLDHHFTSHFKVDKGNNYDWILRNSALPTTIDGTPLREAYENSQKTGGSYTILLKQTLCYSGGMAGLV